MFEKPMASKKEEMETGKKEEPEKDEAKKERIEKERQEKIEKIQKLAGDIKGIYDSFEDKSVLEKYFNTPAYDGGKVGYGSLHHYIYSAAFKGGEFSKEKPYMSTSEEANDILERMVNISEKSIDKAGESDPNDKTGPEDKKLVELGMLHGVIESLDLLKSKLLVAARMEGKTEKPHSLARVPEELRSAIFGYLEAGSESYIVSENSELKHVEMDENTARVIIETHAEKKVTGNQVTHSSTQKTLNFKKTEEGWKIGI